MILRLRKDTTAILKQKENSALIFSGVIPGTGKVYENDHRSGAFCASCGHYAGHVAIYVGDGYVAGSQVPYLQSIDVWISIYGYGGWSKR